MKKLSLLVAGVVGLGLIPFQALAASESIDVSLSDTTPEKEQPLDLTFSIDNDTQMTEVVITVRRKDGSLYKLAGEQYYDIGKEREAFYNKGFMVSTNDFDKGLTLVTDDYTKLYDFITFEEYGDYKVTVEAKNDADIQGSLFFSVSDSTYVLTEAEIAAKEEQRELEEEEDKSNNNENEDYISLDTTEKVSDEVIEQVRLAVCNQLEVNDTKVGYAYKDFDYKKAYFADTKDTAYESAVQSLLDYCIVHGYGDTGTFFGVNDYLTVGQAYKMFARIILADYSQYSSIDVTEQSNWSTPYERSSTALWADVKSSYTSQEQLITMKDFATIAVLVMDKYLPRTNTIDFDSLPNGLIKRGDAAILVEGLVIKLYQTREADFGSSSSSTSSATSTVETDIVEDDTETDVVAEEETTQEVQEEETQEELTGEDDEILEAFESLLEGLSDL